MYIFLDVDGVLNRESDWNKHFTLNPECIANFKELVKHIPDAKIVLSSTWRNGIARDGKKAKHIEDLISMIETAGIHTVDKTAYSPDGNRSREIEYFLKRHEKDNYLILDDDRSIFDKGTSNLYIIDSIKGITSDDVTRIIKSISR